MQNNKKKLFDFHENRFIEMTKILKTQNLFALGFFLYHWYN